MTPPKTHAAYAHLIEPCDDLARPLDHYVNAFPRARGGFVLDGGNVTILGLEPFASFRAFRAGLSPGCPKARVVHTHQGGAPREFLVDDVFAAMRAVFAEYTPNETVFAERPLPLLGGAVGYFGYEIAQLLERLPNLPRPQLRTALPDVAFFFHDWVLGRCKQTDRSFLSVLGRGQNASEAREHAEGTRDRIRAALASFEAQSATLEVTETTKKKIIRSANVSPRSPRVATTSVTREAYIEKIEHAKERIRIGDAFEICLTHRMSADFSGDAFSLWQTLNKKNPAPFASFLDMPEGAVVSSSPERFLSLSEKPSDKSTTTRVPLRPRTRIRIVESRPIKGTRRRGKTPAEDAALARELASAIKDRAEHVMIVDLVRNDLGRICELGTVHVPALYEIERYATVHQLVSTVRGELRHDLDAFDAVRACFPPGSMTGAPKIEAMTILEPLEPEERGVYSGALGWFDYSGTMDLSVVIRSLLVQQGTAYFHVGGAVVADSDPSSEYAETMLKAEALLDALATTNVAEPP